MYVIYIYSIWIVIATARKICASLKGSRNSPKAHEISQNANEQRHTKKKSRSEKQKNGRRYAVYDVCNLREYRLCERVFMV